MTDFAQHPLWDVERDEPYLPLPGFPDLRLTPYRKGDDEAAISLGNDPVVTAVSFRRPVPYLPEHTAFIWETAHPACLKTINSIRPLLASAATTPSPHSSPPPPVPARAQMEDPYYPLPVIRHHPSGLLIGDLALFPLAPETAPTAIDKPVVDEEGILAATTDGSTKHIASTSKETDGDAQQQLRGRATKPVSGWEIGYTLSAPYRGKGVSKTAVRAVLEGWVKWTGISKVVGVAQTSNQASLAIMRRNGFVPVKTFMQEWPADKGGGEREVCRLELDLYSPHPPYASPVSLKRPDHARSMSSRNLDGYAIHPHWDEKRDEPYLPLPNFPDLRMTPFREGDDEAFIEISNDEQVRKFSLRRPYPFLQDHMDIVWVDIHPKSLATIDAIRPYFTSSNPPTTASSADILPNGSKTQPVPPLDANSIPDRIRIPDPYFPCSVIRDQTTGRLAGILGLRHSIQRADEWEMAYNLLPPYRGKRLIKEAFGAVLAGWMKWTGMRVLIAHHEKDNTASEAVLRSLEFQQVETFMKEWPASKGGGWREIKKWRYVVDDVLRIGGTVQID